MIAPSGAACAVTRRRDDCAQDPWNGRHRCFVRARQEMVKKTVCGILDSWAEMVPSRRPPLVARTRWSQWTRC